MMPLHRPLALALFSIALAAPATPTARQSAADAPRIQLELARTSLREGQQDLALNEFEDLVAKYPASPHAADALLEIATYRFSVTRDYEQAAAKVEEILQKYQTADAAAMALVLRGRIMVARGRTSARIDEALAQFRKAQQFYKNTDTEPIARFYEADTYRLTGRHREALDGYIGVATDYPRSRWAAESRLGAALCFVALADPFSAIGELQRVRAKFPGSEQAATALQWNTALYRLHVGMPRQAGFAYAGRALPAAPAKLRDVDAIAITPKGEVVVVTSNTAMLLSATGAPGRSWAPAARGLLIDASGRVLAVQKGALTPEKGNTLALAVPKPDGQLKPLDDVAAAVAWATGEFLVSDKSSRAILKFSADGKPQGSFAPGLAHRLAVNLLDQVAALDTDAKTVRVIDRDGKTIRTIGQGQGSELGRPVDVAFDALGYLYILDRAFGVHVYSPAGALVYRLTIPEKQPGGFKDAAAFALDGADRLYIYDAREQRIQVYQ